MTEQTTDKERMDWIMRNISGKEARELGIEYSGNMRREDIDAAMVKETKQND